MSEEAQTNVLIVDDRPENLLAMESILSGPDITLVNAMSAREALRFLLVNDAALILLDVQMPGLNGFELAELIREREKTQHTPIIFVSATSVDDHYVFKGYSLGAVDYLTKPLIPEILKSKVSFFTRLFRQNQEIVRQAGLLERANTKLDTLNSDLEVRVKRRTIELEEANKKLEHEVEIRRESEGRLAIEHSVTRTLAAASGIDTASPLILRAFCDHLRAEFAALWLLDESGTHLRCINSQESNSPIDVSEFARKSHGMSFGRGEGLPGHVWNELAPVWHSNTYVGPKYPRAGIAASIGLKGAIAFPIMIGSEFCGVIEFFTVEPIDSKDVMVGMLEAIGTEVGQFLFRKRIEAEKENLLVQEKSLRRQAEKASRLKDEFLATVSHELRTPLNSILGWGQLLNSGKLDDKEKDSALETIHRNAKSQAQLIDDLLDTSRLIAGNFQLELSPTPVKPLIQAAVDTVLPAAEAKGISISTSFSSEIDTLTCDSQRLQQMVWNLLTNAVKFTPVDGSVSVSLNAVGDRAEIAVSDTGVGIAEEFLPFVFDRFSQEDSSSTRSHDGIGLGLAIVRHLAELHGGKVSVESDGPGKGAKFAITLPLTLIVRRSPNPSRTRSNGDAAESHVPADLHGLRVLIVDDDQDACNLLKFALRDTGAEVETRFSAHEAFESITSWEPHILLTDLNMPGEDGYSLLNRVRQLESPTANLPAIALTAMARPEDSERVLTAGFQLHIPKPVDIDELTGAIVELTNFTAA